jgi:iron complex outermembrane receptor protein
LRFVKYIPTLAALIVGAAGPSPAFAQRAGENVLTSAEDAFGTTVGNETIGLYSAGNARGFSPVRAGNVRLEGLYFDTRGGGGGAVRMSSRVIGQATVRVGLSAQSYPFIAPTGVADYTLRVPGDEYSLSTVFRAGYPEAESIEIDGQIPVTENFSLGLGISGEHTTTDYGETFYSADGAVIGRWNIGDVAQFIPFWSRSRNFENEWGPLVFLAGTELPAKFDRDLSFTQKWAYYNTDDTNYGGVFKANWDDWRLRIGLFRSVAWRLQDSSQAHYRNVQSDGSAQLQYTRLGVWPLPHSSKSGEIRVSRIFLEGDRRHTLHVNARGKASGTGNGGNTSMQAGPIHYGTPVVLPQPTFAAGLRGREYVRQATFGVSYGVLWKDVGELSAGLQRTLYKRFTVNPASRSSTQEWLYNATASVYASDRLVLYSGYTRGLEDAPRAPPYAANGGAGAAATFTQQMDGGFRYTLMPGVRLVGGVFEVKKPLFDLDQAQFFRELGNVRHRGVEVSLSGSPAPGFTIVAGVVGLQARLSGPLVDNGTMGAIPPETIPLNGILNVQYGPSSWNGFSIDARMSYNDSYMANVQNTFKSAAITMIDLGARYRFRIAEQQALLRFQVTNVLNVWEWRITGTQKQIDPTPQRKFSLQLTVDY